MMNGYQNGSHMPPQQQQQQMMPPMPQGQNPSMMNSQQPQTQQQFLPPGSQSSGFAPPAKPLPGSGTMQMENYGQNPASSVQQCQQIPSSQYQQSSGGGFPQGMPQLSGGGGQQVGNNGYPQQSSNAMYQNGPHASSQTTPSHQQFPGGFPQVSGAPTVSSGPQTAHVQPQMAQSQQQLDRSYEQPAVSYAQANGPSPSSMSQGQQRLPGMPQPPTNFPQGYTQQQFQQQVPTQGQHQGTFGGQQPMQNQLPAGGGRPGLPPMPPGMSGAPQQAQQGASTPQIMMGGRPGMPPMPQTSGGGMPQMSGGGMPQMSGGGMSQMSGGGMPRMPVGGMPQVPGGGMPPMPQPPGGGMPQMQGQQHGMGAGGMPQMGGPMPPGPPGMQQQPQRRLDPNMMPSAIQVILDNSNDRSGLFQTGFPAADIPPLVTTDFYVEDQGNCNPKFMRCTMYCAPANSDLLKTSAMPFGASICPLARQDRREYAPPVINLGDLGPVRCHRCKAYMCPFMEFQDGGRRFRCPFCKSSSEVPTEYFAHLDHQGRRTDLYERPELYLGSVEFVATKEYCKNGVMPKPPAFIFMLDVSYNSVKNGIVQLFCENIKHILEDLPKELGMEESTMKVGFATYDQSVHFYNLKNSLDQPQMMIVGDIQDMFVPMVEGFLVSPKEAEAAIDSLLQEIPSMFAETRITEIILGPVIQAGMDALKAADRAGKLFIFHSSLPILEAPGKLKNREDRKLLGTEKEKTVLSPDGEFYSKLAQECVSVGCCVDVFLFPNSYMDVATIGNMCGTTGGQVYKYPYFELGNDGRRFLEDLHHDVERPIAFDAMMRIRTSTGIRPTDFFGNIYMSNTTDMELAAIDSDKAVTIEIRHDDKLEEPTAYIQAAMLFTSVSGQRRLRIHNVALPVAENHQNMYRLADLDTTVNFIAKHAGRLLMQKQPKDVKEYLIGRCAQILATYRERCSEQAPSGQLILPECMKLLPLYTSCILKNDAFFGGSDLTTDDKAWLLQSVPSLRVVDSVSFFYPRIFPVRDLAPEAAESDNFDLPSPVRCGYENLTQDGVFLLENGIMMFLWIGLGCPSDWVQDVFGCNAVAQINVDKHDLPEKDNGRSRGLRRLMKRIQRPRPRMMKLYIITQQSKLEPWMKKFLVEDRGVDNAPSYVDFLCHVHREIRQILN